MDPASVVGLAASIIQLIETTATVLRYANDVRDAPTERAQFARHASSLLALLTDLRYRVEEAKSASEPWFVALRGLGVEGGPLDELKDRMERLATKLQPLPAGRLEKARKALTWTLDKKEISEVLVQIERAKTLVMLALQNDQFKLTLAMKQDLTDVKEDLREAIGGANAEREDKEFDQVTSWLSTLDFTAKQIDFLRRRQTGTGDWLLSDPIFRDWVDGKERTLWCRGLPGAGKTILASIVIDWLESQHRAKNAAVVYLYCSYKEEEIQTLDNMIGSLLKQLVQHQATIPSNVHKLYTKYLKKKTRPRLDEIAPLLAQEIANFPLVFVVIDALDECPERANTRVRLLTEIQNLPQNARIFITSRYSSVIEEKVGNTSQIDIRATDDDVKRYVEARVEKETLLAKHVRSSPGMMEEITQTVVRISRGMFLLAQLHMDSLARKLNRREVRAALVSLPTELDNTYDQAMQRIQSQDEGQIALAHKVLYWISYALRPLTVAELQNALAVEIGDDDLDEDGLYETELMVSVCAGLVTVDREGDQIRLVHYTTQSYFDRVRSKLFPEAPSTISKVCLTYLAFVPFGKTLCSSKEEFKDRLDKYPFLNYAASYWGDHLRSGMDDEVRELAIEYLRNNISILSTCQAASNGNRLYSLGWDRFTRITANVTRLHAIAFFDVAEIAGDLLTESVDVNAKADLGTTPLHLAAAMGHVQMVHFLLRAGADVSPKAINGQTPLHMAVERGCEDVVRLLIDAGADYNRRTMSRGKSPLHFAVEYGHVDIAELLVGKGADVNQKDGDEYDRYRRLEEYFNYGATPLSRAAEGGYEDLVLLLLNKGADISATSKIGRTALHGAVLAGHTRAVEILIARGIDISTTDEKGRTALHYAVEKGQIDIVQILLKSNADVLSEDKRGRTPVHEAAESEHESILQLLLGRISSEGNKTEKWLTNIGLCRAVDQADADNVRRLLGKGADPNAENQDGASILHVAIARENADVLQFLLDNGADANLKDILGRTPLHWAAHRGYGTGIQLLLDHGADIQAADVDGATPLHMAAKKGGASTVNQLLDNGARLDVCDKRGVTALGWVFESRVGGYAPLMSEHRHGIRTKENVGDVESPEKRLEGKMRNTNRSLPVLDALIERGVDVNAPCSQRETPLMMAISPGAATAIVRRLLEKGENAASQSDDGTSALYRAALYNLPRVVRLLLEYGADVNQTNKRKLHRYPAIRRRLAKGVTALHQAAMNGSYEISRMLIEAGADVQAVDEDGFTVLHEAVTEGGSGDIVELLVARGVSLNARYGEKGATVLHHAAALGNVAMVQYLLKRGFKSVRQISRGRRLWTGPNVRAVKQWYFYCGSMAHSTGL